MPLYYRPYRNSDTPELARLMRAYALECGADAPITGSMLEDNIFTKPFFDPQGFMIAEDIDLEQGDSRLLGFAHASFGPNSSKSDIDRKNGIISQVSVWSDSNQADVSRSKIASELLRHCEQYLVGQGAETIQGGEFRKNYPFYIGLYGGSEPPGVLESDSLMRNVLKESGFQKQIRTTKYAINLRDYHIVQGSRFDALEHEEIQVDRFIDPILKWWSLWTVLHGESLYFVFRPRNLRKKLIGTVMLRPMKMTDEGPIYGLLDVRVYQHFRHQSWGVFMLDHVFRELRRGGVSRIEAWCSDAPRELYVAPLLERVRMTPTGENGTVFLKNLRPDAGLEE
jgi:hypothetical protein